jgi:hypothetical protein
MLVAHSILERIQAEQKPDGERGTCPQAGPGGQVSYVLNLDALVDSQVLQAGPYRRMLDRIVPINIFNP